MTPQRVGMDTLYRTAASGETEKTENLNLPAKPRVSRCPMGLN